MKDQSAWLAELERLAIRLYAKTANMEDLTAILKHASARPATALSDDRPSVSSPADLALMQQAHGALSDVIHYFWTAEREPGGLREWDVEALVRAAETVLGQRLKEKPGEICAHGIHMDNACGSCVPPRGTVVHNPKWWATRLWRAAEYAARGVNTSAEASDGGAP